MQKRTVECCVHSSHIHQQTDHGHIQRSRPLGQKLVLEYLAALATLRHSIEVDIGKGVPIRFIRDFVKYFLFVLEDIFKKVKLYILAPQRDTVLLLKMPNFVARVD